MAEKKISQLTEATTRADAMELVVNDSGTSKKITAANFIEGLTPVFTEISAPASPDSFDDEFDSTFDTSTKWSVDSGAVTGWTTEDGQLIIPQSGGGFVSQAITGSAWTLEWCGAVPFGFPTNNTALSVFVHRSSNNRQVDFGVWRDGSAQQKFFVNRFSNYAWSSTPSSLALRSYREYMEFVENKLVLASGTLTHSVRMMGMSGWYTVNTESVASWLGGDPTAAGIFIATQNVMRGLFRYIRKTA